MEIRQLRYFISAAAHLNFTKAARECFVAQSSLAQQIANLEDELGVRLFERQTRGLALTEAGEFFLQKAKSLVAEAQKAEIEMSSFRGGYRALLRIGYFGGFFNEPLVILLRQLRKEMPEIKVMLHQLPEMDQIAALRDGEIDLAMLFYGNFFEDLTWMDWELLHEVEHRFAVAVDHPLAERDSITMEEISSLPVLSYMRESDTKSDMIIAQENWEGEKYTRAADDSSINILVRSGYATSFWTISDGSNEQFHDLKLLKITDYPGKEQIALAWRKGMLNPGGEFFHTAARSYFQREETPEKL